MNRRGFFGLLGAGLAGFALDPERLLWVPGQKTFFLPSGVRFQDPVFLAPEWVEAFQRLFDKLEWKRFPSCPIATCVPEPLSGPGLYPSGDVSLRLPMRCAVVEGKAAR